MFSARRGHRLTLTRAFGAMHQALLQARIDSTRERMDH